MRRALIEAHHLLSQGVPLPADLRNTLSNGGVNVAALERKYSL